MSKGKTPERRGGGGRGGAYTGRGNAGAPVCVGLDGDVGQGGAEQRTQELPKALHLQREGGGGRGQGVTFSEGTGQVGKVQAVSPAVVPWRSSSACCPGSARR